MYETRKHQIMKLLEQKETISVKEIKEQFDVSPMTIQRDLTKMEQEGLITRGFGEISRVKGIFLERLMLEQEKDVPENQHKIAAYASTLIEDGDTVIFGNGNIIADLSKHCLSKKFTAITPSVRAALSLASASGDVYMTGGKLGNGAKSLYGEYSEMILSHFYADKAFITCASVNSEYEMCEYSEEEVRLMRLIVEHAKQTYLLLESEKFGKSKIFRSMSITRITDLITVRFIPEDYRQLCEEHAINLHLVG